MSAMCLLCLSVSGMDNQAVWNTRVTLFISSAEIVQVEAHVLEVADGMNSVLFPLHRPVNVRCRGQTTREK